MISQQDSLGSERDAEAVFTSPWRDGYPGNSHLYAFLLKNKDTRAINSWNLEVI